MNAPSPVVSTTRLEPVWAVSEPKLVFFAGAGFGFEVAMSDGTWRNFIVKGAAQAFYATHRAPSVKDQLAASLEQTP